MRFKAVEAQNEDTKMQLKWNNGYILFLAFAALSQTLQS